jgi:hypothetical protein
MGNEQNTQKQMGNEQNIQKQMGNEQNNIRKTSQSKLINK